MKSKVDCFFFGVVWGKDCNTMPHPQEYAKTLPNLTAPVLLCKDTHLIWHKKINHDFILSIIFWGGWALTTDLGFCTDLGFASHSLCILRKKQK